MKPNDLIKTLKHITGYSDADWAGDPVTRNSTSCTLCYVDQFLLTSECRGQGTVALSCGESELYALGALSAGLIFAQAILKEIGRGEKSEMLGSHTLREAPLSHPSGASPPTPCGKPPPHPAEAPPPPPPPQTPLSPPPSQTPLSQKYWKPKMAKVELAKVELNTQHFFGVGQSGMGQNRTKCWPVEIG